MTPIDYPISHVGDQRCARIDAKSIHGGRFSIAHAKSSVKIVFGSRVVVDLYVALIVSHAGFASAVPVVGVLRQKGKRIKSRGEEIGRHRINHRLRDLISRKRLANHRNRARLRKRIKELIAQRAEISAAPSRRNNCADAAGESLAAPPSLIIREEEQFIGFDRATQNAAENILSEMRPRLARRVSKP